MYRWRRYLAHRAAQGFNSILGSRGLEMKRGFASVLSACVCTPPANRATIAAALF